jgi:serine/threonine-protein kinase
MKYGRYQIVKELGKGTMGVVYEAHDPQIDRLVALKILRPDRMVNEAYVGRFLKEARAIGRLAHPSIVTIYDVGEDNDTIYIAMEYLKGKPFDQVIRSGSLSVAQCIDIAHQVAEALDYAHKQAIVHRDIKPSNIILTEDYKVKLTDFGIARIEDAATMYQTKAGEILGTPVYMSPEQTMGQTVDGRSDLYALGVILYEMIVGRRPFTGNNIAAILRAITQDTPESPADVDQFIPRALSDLIMKSIARDPSKRFQTGRQMADSLASTIIPSEDAAPPAGKEKKPAKATVGGRKAITVIAALVVAVCIAVGAYFLLSGQDTDSIPGHHKTAGGEMPISEPFEAPKPEPAVLVINSEPEGAQVYVNGEFKGKTPTELSLPMGKYEVRLNLPDHLEWEGQIDLDTPGQRPSLHIPLRSLN